MFKTLYAKLALGLITLLVAIGLLYLFISATVARHYLQEVNQHFNRDLARNLVADRNLVAEGRLNQQALKETFHQYMVINPSIEIYLLDLDGQILSYSADPGKVKRKRVALEPIHAFLRMEQPYPLLGDDPRSHDRRKAFSVTQVPSSDNPQGYLYVVLRGERFDSVEQVIRESLFLKLSGWAVVGSLGVGLLAGLLLFRLLTRRLQRLSSLMEAFEVSQFSGEVHYRDGTAVGNDEIDRLGSTFDRMAERLREQWEQLQQQDGLRRRLVAQVSHDLRTPLASMMGYLESLELKGEDLSAEERSDAIATALRQGQRLNKLVTELFELASLEARESQPVCEPFAPAELVSDVVQKHRLRAEQQGIDLHFLPEPGLPLALGDLGMTERVLDNLIENALTHSREGDAITLSLQVEEGSLEISVADSGSGIAIEDLPHIFEPFYQAAKGSNGNGHAGLGLAIAQRLMVLQRGSIRVASRAGEGATFIIVLPLA